MHGIVKATCPELDIALRRFTIVAAPWHCDHLSVEEIVYIQIVTDNLESFQWHGNHEDISTA